MAISASASTTYSNPSQKKGAPRFTILLKIEPLTALVCKHISSRSFVQRFPKGEDEVRSVYAVLCAVPLVFLNIRITVGYSNIGKASCHHPHQYDQVTIRLKTDKVA